MNTFILIMVYLNMAFAVFGQLAGLPAANCAVSGIVGLFLYLSLIERKLDSKESK